MTVPPEAAVLVRPLHEPLKPNRLLTPAQDSCCNPETFVRSSVEEERESDVRAVVQGFNARTGISGKSLPNRGFSLCPRDLRPQLPGREERENSCFGSGVIVNFG